MDKFNNSSLKIWMVWSGLAMALALWPLPTLATGPGVTFHGRLTDSLDQPVLGSSVTLKVQVRSTGSEDCLLYSESQTVNLSASDGVFAITLNDGSGNRHDTTGINFEDLFSNNKAFTGLTCNSGTSWTPTPTEARNIQVAFQDGANSWETFAASPINYVPQAIEAQKIAGYSKSQLLRVADGVSTSSTEFNSNDWTSFLSLLAGTSSHYLKTTGPVTFSGAPSWATAPTSASELANKAYVDAQVAGAALPDIVSIGTYSKVTIDTKGRVTSGSTSLVEADIPTLTTANKVNGSAITALTITDSHISSITTPGKLAVGAVAGTSGISMGGVSGLGTGFSIDSVSGTGTTGLKVSGVSASAKGIDILNVSSGTGVKISSSSAGTGLFIDALTSGTPAAKIDNIGGGPALIIPNGKVGIGTISPAEKLEVFGTVKMSSLKLEVNTTEPVACNPAQDGLIALASNHKLCVCDGSAWKQTENPTTACLW